MFLSLQEERPLRLYFGNGPRIHKQLCIKYGVVDKRCEKCGKVGQLTCFSPAFRKWVCRVCMYLLLLLIDHEYNTIIHTSLSGLFKFVALSLFPEYIALMTFSYVFMILGFRESYRRRTQPNLQNMQ